MGVDIHVKITKYNEETHLYEELRLFRKRKPNEKQYSYTEEGCVELPWDDYKEIYIDLGRNYEMFDGMKDGTEEDGYGVFPWQSLVLSSFEPSFIEKMKEEKSFGYFDFYEINLSDLKLYLIHHPTVVDYEYGETEVEIKRKINPITYIDEKIMAFISLADPEYDFSPNSYYKIVFYFDN